MKVELREQSCRVVVAIRAAWDSNAHVHIVHLDLKPETTTTVLCVATERRWNARFMVF